MEVFKVAFYLTIFATHAFASSDAIKVPPKMLGYSFSQEPEYQIIQDEHCADAQTIQTNAKIDFQDEETFKSHFLNSIPPSNDCTWLLPMFSYKRLSSDNPITKHYDKKYITDGIKGYVNCYGSQGIPVDRFEQTIYPIYTCPEGSFYHRLGCFQIDPEHCSGDIVARDLDIALPIVRNQGHVGILFRQDYAALDVGENLMSYVIEVLNNEMVINATTPSNFVDAVPGGYWGEKFGTSSNPVITQENVDHVLNSLENIFEKINDGALLEYTLSWRISTGEPHIQYYYNKKKRKFIKTRVNKPVSFRCDTFVKYLFEQAGIQFDTGSLITPRSFYASLLHTRNGNPSYNNVNTSLLSTSSPEKLEDEIELAFTNDYPLNILDELTFSYLTDDTIPKERKTAFILKQIDLHKSDENKLLYLLDLLRDSNVFHKHQEMMDLYRQATNHSVRTKVITLLMEAILFDTRDETEQLTDDDIASIVEIEAFIIKHMDPDASRNQQKQINNINEIRNKLLTSRSIA